MRSKDWETAIKNSPLKVTELAYIGPSRNTEGKMQRIEYFTKAMLLLASHEARKVGYNRQLNDDYIAELEDINYPVTFSMMHEHIAGQLVDPHVRCLVRVSNEDSPLQVDCSMAFFENLPTKLVELRD